MKFILVAIAAASLFAEEPSAPAKALTTPSSFINESLPKWIRLSFDHRFRFENYTNLKNVKGNDDQWLLNRFRVNLTITPTSWWSFTFQGQDARIFFKGNAAGQAPFTNRFDLRMAYTELGDTAKGKIALRVGRQELSIGEERLLGPANWGNVGRTFDAAKLIMHKGPYQLDLFAAAVVIPLQNGYSHHQPGNNLHGAVFKWINILPKQNLESYFLWHVGPGRADTPAQTARNGDRRISGVRFWGNLPANLDYVTENDFEAGSIGGTSIGAYASHWNLRYSFKNWKWKPQAGVEYNYASGDKNPGDGKSGTFDQLYPTPHDKTGLADQVGWQNVHDAQAFFNFTPWRALTFKTTFHNWYLAQAKDGVYLTNGNLVHRDVTGKSGKHIGEELDATAIYTKGPYTYGMGLGHIWTGEFLQHFGNGANINYFYLNVGYRF